MKRMVKIFSFVLLVSLLGSGTLTGTVSAADVGTPANPLEKEGYTLIANDEFDSNSLDQNLWIDEYLPHWTNPALSKARYSFRDGAIHLRIDPDSTPWDPDHDQETVISGIQTAEKNYLHRWTNYSSLHHSEESVNLHLQKYGYFELRAKLQAGGGIHNAWWMIGFQEDAPDWARSRQTCEIDIFEAVGRGNADKIKYNIIPWNDEKISGTSVLHERQLPFRFDDAYHVYGFEWDETTMKLYVDGELFAINDQSVTYPMLTLLGLYEKRHPGGWSGPFDPNVPYPKEFSIDYWRAYQRSDMLNRFTEAEDMKLTGASKHDLWYTSASMNRAVRFIGNGIENSLSHDYLYAGQAGDYEMRIDYLSGENRTLYVSVNDEAPVALTNLNSGGFKKVATVSFIHALRQGNNSIRFYNPDAYAPDIDCFYLTPVQNLARLATVRASTLNPINHQGRIADFNPTSYFESNPLITAEDIDLSWADSQTISQLILECFEGKTRGIRSFELQVSNDGAQYQTIKSVELLPWTSEDKTLERITIPLDEPVQTRYLRLHVTDKNSALRGFILNELEVR